MCPERKSRAIPTQKSYLRHHVDFSRKSSSLVHLFSLLLINLKSIVSSNKEQDNDNDDDEQEAEEEDDNADNDDDEKEEK